MNGQQNLLKYLKKVRRETYGEKHREWAARNLARGIASEKQAKNLLHQIAPQLGECYPNFKLTRKDRTVSEIDLFYPQTAVVVEVKSGKKPLARRQAHRQIDRAIRELYRRNLVGDMAVGLTVTPDVRQIMFYWQGLPEGTWERVSTQTLKKRLAKLTAADNPMLSFVLYCLKLASQGTENCFRVQLP